MAGRESGAEDLICVTGATGWIAAFIVRDLLVTGRRVRGTVRSLGNAARLEPLLSLPGAKERLQLVEADMTDPSSFDAMLQGCSGGLIHTATPIEIPVGKSPPASAEEVQRKQIGPAVDGTNALLRAAARQHIPKVVLTSSIAAMLVRREPPKLFDESCWSDLEILRESMYTSWVAAYRMAKTQQELDATRLCKEFGIKLCVINPAFVIGPTLTPKNFNFSLQGLASMVAGHGSPLCPSAPGTLPDRFQAVVDVREVSEAHVKALVDESASGRYLLQSHSAHYADLASMMRRSRQWLWWMLPALPVDSVDGMPHAECTPFNNSRAFKELGVAQIPLETSVLASVDALILQGHWSSYLPGRGAPAWKLAATAVVLASALAVAKAVGKAKRS